MKNKLFLSNKFILEILSVWQSMLNTNSNLVVKKMNAMFLVQMKKTKWFKVIHNINYISNIVTCNTMKTHISPHNSNAMKICLYVSYVLYYIMYHIWVSFNLCMINRYTFQIVQVTVTVLWLIKELANNLPIFIIVSLIQKCGVTTTPHDYYSMLCCSFECVWFLITI